MPTHTKSDEVIEPQVQHTANTARHMGQITDARMLRLAASLGLEDDGPLF